MATHDVVRAWKDPHYRASLTGADRTRLPEHPAGIVEVPEQRLDIAGVGDLNCTMDACSMEACTSYWDCPETYNWECLMQ